MGTSRWDFSIALFCLLYFVWLFLFNLKKYPATTCMYMYIVIQLQPGDQKAVVQNMGSIRLDF